jgi:thioredoxin reductase
MTDETFVILGAGLAGANAADTCARRALTGASS